MTRDAPSITSSRPPFVRSDALGRATTAADAVENSIANTCAGPSAGIGEEASPHARTNASVHPCQPVNGRDHARVLMVLEGPYPSARGGGAEAQVRTISAAMRRQGRRVTVLAPLTAHAPQRRVVRVDGVPVCRLRYPQVRWLGGPWLWASLAWLLYTRRHRYDVWHVHVARSWAVACALLGPWLGKRVVVKVSGSWDLEHGALAPDTRWRARLPYRCLRRAHAWQAISHRITATLAQRGLPASRIFTIPNAVDTDRFARVTRTQAAGGRTTRFLFIGRLVEEKGLPMLLDAFADVAAKDARVHLTLAGTGPLLDSLTRQAAGLGIDEHITFAGHRDDIDALLADADIGVLASRFEGLSNALLECMAAGLPMLASRISGNEDFVVHGENGWLFESRDRQGLSACLAEAAALTAGQRETMGACARATVKRQAGLERVLASLSAVYGHDPRPAAAGKTLQRST